MNEFESIAEPTAHALQTENEEAATPESAEPVPYWCFISYRHADNRVQDRDWASWLHQEIERYEVPAELIGTRNERGDVIPERIYPVFRDEDSLPADADLASSIVHALDRSRFLVVLCSPRAVQSRYVADEIRHFKQAERSDRIIAAIIDGEPGDLERECFPEPLRFDLAPDGEPDRTRTVEPIAADFRLGDGSQGFTSTEAYRLHVSQQKGLSRARVRERAEAYEQKLQLMKLKIIAGILGISLERLRDRDRIYQLELSRKRARTLRRWLAGVAVLALIAILLGFLAERNRRESVANFSRSDVLTAGRLQDDQKVSDAVAHLCRAIRTDPSNRFARDKLVATLLHGGIVPVLSEYRDPEHFRYRLRASGLVSLSFDESGSSLLMEDHVDKSFRILYLWDGVPGHKALRLPLDLEGRYNYLVRLDGKGFVVQKGSQTGLRTYAFPDPVATRLRAYQDILRRLNLERDEGKIESLRREHDQLERELLKEWKTGVLETELNLVPGKWYEAGNRQTILASDSDTVLLWGGKMAQLWSLRTGRAISNVLTHSSPVSAAALDSSATTVVTGTKRGELAVWRGKGHKVELLRRFPSEMVPITEVAVNTGGSVVAASASGTVSVWEVGSGSHLRYYPHLERPEQWAGGQRLLWEESQAWHTIRGSQNDVVTIAMDRNAGKVVTGSGRKLRVWASRNGSPICAPLELPGKVQSAAFSPDGTRLAVGTENGFISVWDWGRAALSQPGIARAALASDTCAGSFLAVSASGKDAVVIDLATGLEKARMQHPAEVWMTRLSGDGSLLVTAAGGDLFRWRPKDGVSLGEPISFLGEANRMIVDDWVLNHDGSSLVMVLADVDGVQVHHWDLRREPPAEVRRLEEGDGEHRSRFKFWGGDGTRRPVTVQLNRGGSRALVRSATKYGAGLYVFDLETGSVLFATTSEETIVDLAKLRGVLSPDGLSVALLENTTVRVVDAVTGEERLSPLHHDDFVTAMAFDPSGNRLLTGTADGWVFVRDLADGALVTRPLSHPDRIDALAMDNGGALVAAGIGERMLQVWDVASGEALTPLMSMEKSPSARLRAIAFTGDGTGVCASLSSRPQPADGPDRERPVEGFLFWQIPRWGDREVPEWFLELAEAMAGRRLADDGLPVSIPFGRFHELRRELDLQPGGTPAVDLAKRLLKSPRDDGSNAEHGDRKPEPAQPSPILQHDFSKRELGKFVMAFERNSESNDPDSGFEIYSIDQRIDKKNRDDEVDTNGLENFLSSSTRSDQAEAYFAKGKAMHKGDGVPRNLDGALAAYQRAAKLGHAGAMHQPGVMYALGEGVGKDESKVIYWYRKSAALGFAEAQYDLGVRYILGRGVATNEKAGIELYQKAAAQGYEEAIEALKRRGY